MENKEIAKRYGKIEKLNEDIWEYPFQRIIKRNEFGEKILKELLDYCNFKNENPEDAFYREVAEETGCKVEIIKYLGVTEEYKYKNNFKQISYIYVSKVIEDTQKLNLTQKEKDEGAKLLWVEPIEALELIQNCINDLKDSQYEDVYATKFVVLRDRRILEYYLDI